MDENKKDIKQEAEDFHEMPEVHIDSDYQQVEKKTTNNKLLIIGILVVLLIAVIGIAYTFITSRDSGSSKKETETVQKVDEEEEETTPSDTTAPEFIAFNNHLVVELNALDVDLSKYFLAIDNNKQAKVTVEGNVNLAQEGEYPVTVIATDDAGNKIENAATVQVISENTMATGIEFSCYLDGSVPLEAGTKERLLANVIYFYYQDLPQEISNKISELGIDVSGYATATTWNPSMLNNTTNAIQ